MNRRRQSAQCGARRFERMPEPASSQDRKEFAITASKKDLIRIARTYERYDAEV